MHLDPYHFCSCVVVLTMSFPRFLFGLNCAPGMKKKCVSSRRDVLSPARDTGDGRKEVREKEV